jgi:hypothetical protein
VDGETEHDALLEAAEAGGKRQRLAQPQKVVGLIAQADEAPGQAADAAGQTDGLAPLLFDGQQDVY